MRAYFGQPREEPVAGGAQVALYLVPVFEGRLVVFDVPVAQARGRWLPWDIIDFGANPYESAAGLVDDWCEGEVDDLALVDVMSFMLPGETWELALVFRAHLIRVPEPRADRVPFVFAEGAFDAIGLFDPVDIERWVGEPRAGGTEATGKRSSLLF